MRGYRRQLVREAVGADPTGEHRLPIPAAAAGRFVADLRAVLARRKDRVVLDLARLASLEDGAVGELVAGLAGHRDRIRIILPRMGEFAALAAIFPLYR